MKVRVLLNYMVLKVKRNIIEKNLFELNLLRLIEMNVNLSFFNILGEIFFFYLLL